MPQPMMSDADDLKTRTRAVIEEVIRVRRRVFDIARDFDIDIAPNAPLIDAIDACPLSFQFAPGG